MHSFDLAGTGHPACRRCPIGQVPAAALPGTAAARSRFRKRPHPLTTVALTHAWRAQLASTVSRIPMSGLIALVWENSRCNPPDGWAVHRHIVEPTVPDVCTAVQEQMHECVLLRVPY